MASRTESVQFLNTVEMEKRAKKDIANLRAVLRRMVKKDPQAVMAAMYEEASDIFRESQLLVPVDTGRLRSSGLIAAGKDAGGFRIIISYGTKYALKIHEEEKYDLARRERASGVRWRSSLGTFMKMRGGASVGRSKYLTIPWDLAAPGLLRRIVAGARFYAKGGNPPKTAGKTKKGGVTGGRKRDAKGRFIA